MKPLESLNNVERAKLLHGLFPSEIPAFLKYVSSMSLTIEEEQESIKANWGNQLFAFDFWLSLAREADRKIKQYGINLETSSSLFSDQLFDNYAALYLSHCLYQYTQKRIHTNPKFSLAVRLLFGNEEENPIQKNEDQNERS